MHIFEDKKVFLNFCLNLAISCLTAIPSALLWERAFHLFWFLHVDTSWITAYKNLTHDENIPFIFQLTLPHPPVLCEKLALRSIFLSYPLQNSNAVHVTTSLETLQGFRFLRSKHLALSVDHELLRNHWYWFINEMLNKHKNMTFSPDIA